MRIVERQNITSCFDRNAEAIERLKNQLHESTLDNRVFVGIIFVLDEETQAVGEFDDGDQGNKKGRYQKWQIKQSCAIIIGTGQINDHTQRKQSH